MVIYIVWEHSICSRPKRADIESTPTITITILHNTKNIFNKTMYKKTLKHENRNAKLIMWLTFVCGIFLFFFAGNGKLPYPAVAQTFAIIMVCASIYIATSYILKEYSVEVCLPDNAGTDISVKPDFIVYEQKGRRVIKVCHISLSDVTTMQKYTHINKKEVNRSQKGMFIYKYNSSFLQSEFISITTKDDFVVLITYDEGLFVELKKYL